jgi:hypothetical protein
LYIVVESQNTLRVVVLMEEEEEKEKISYSG